MTIIGKHCPVTCWSIKDWFSRSTITGPRWIAEEICRGRVGLAMGKHQGGNELMHATLMLRSFHVDATLMLRWCYVDITFMLRWHHVGLASVGNDKVEHRNVLSVHHLNKQPGLQAVLTALKKFREVSMKSLQPAPEVFDSALWHR